MAFSQSEVEKPIIEKPIIEEAVEVVNTVAEEKARFVVDEYLNSVKVI